MDAGPHGSEPDERIDAQGYHAVLCVRGGETEIALLEHPLFKGLFSSSLVGVADLDSQREAVVICVVMLSMRYLSYVCAVFICVCMVLLIRCCLMI